MRVYLCGPMDDYTEKEAGDWRVDAKRKLGAYGIVTLSPMDRPYRNKDYKHDPEGVLPDLVEADKIDIELSDVVLVNHTKVSTGSSMETLLGWQKDKQVIVVAPEGLYLSAWTHYHSHKIFHSLDEAYDHIVEFKRRIG